MNTPGFPHFDVAIVGGGPVGLAAAIGLAQNGVPTTLIARKVAYSDNRTTALLGGSIDFLRSLEVWPRCEQQAAALRVMRLIDDTGRLVRAPEVRLSAHEIGEETFGYNIENRILVAALEERACELTNLVRYDDDASTIDGGDSSAGIATKNGAHINAAIVGGADGRNSLARRSAGIDLRTRTLEQAAVTFNTTHTRPHDNISTEFHTPHGPRVFVPLPGLRSSIVWVTTPDEAAQLQSLSDDELGLRAERQAHSIFGKMRAEGERHVFPLTMQSPAALAAHRIALLGEAAHVFPPIGAQGLNLGLRDAADFVRVITAAHQAGTDPGSDDVMSQYSRSRSADIASRTAVIDIANRSLLSGFLPVQMMRAVGLHLLNIADPLRRFAMREGLAPWWRRSA
ncbi:UbiH/UbiF family hydroxylase [[Pseudomonas] carboxydohydrogena]|uniref:UbiH/UbiF family hydroxylase n=1 Tax=Afipia carboxydohydrogena TaxID=290 RepID=A0ABY8BN61_AFICR|nr:UbiH/UbiF family hydroxylase [[Pseudomonas] carboxydohydrogena]WEF50175.1 UbiH/UbiF family hydroxylase [[Pseudomonas] carboxydohydrogena]